MNNNERTAESKTNRSRLSRRLLQRYFLTVAIYIAAVILMVFVGIYFCSRFNWYPEDPVYKILAFVADYIVFFAGMTVLIGWIIITYHYISKPLKYLDQVVAASKQLALTTSEPVILSNELVDTEHELNRVRENALRDAENARDAEQRKNDLIVYLAHDLKTPLTSVIGYLTLLHDERQISDELRDKYLAITLDKSERLEDLINEFFEITRFNLSNITLQMGGVNLTRMLEQLTFEFKPMLASKNLTCSLSCAPELFMRCDVDKMQRVFDNILRNAVFYSDDNTEISIIVEQKENEISLRFINRGETIPGEKLDRIFQQFYRLDASRGTNNGGAGLGLAIAKQIVELHGGRITAESSDRTIIMTICIPAC